MKSNSKFESDIILDLGFTKEPMVSFDKLFSVDRTKILFELNKKFSNSNFICSLDKVRQFLLSRFLIFNTLAQTGLRLDQDVCRESMFFGKPYLILDEKNSSKSDNFKNINNISISHRGDFSLIGYSSKNLGLDIEIVDAPKNLFFEKFAFSQDECLWLDRKKYSNSERAIAQMYLWTAKEAVSKLCGQGLKISTQKIKIVPSEGIEKSISVWNQCSLSEETLDYYEIESGIEKLKNISQNYEQSVDSSGFYNGNGPYRICTNILFWKKSILVYSVAENFLKIGTSNL